MNDPRYLQKEFRTANEPAVHPLIKKSFAFVRSAGMRLAPEILVLEFMREVFFEPANRGTRDLDPDELDNDHRRLYSQNERAVLYALRGRRKKARNSEAQYFFAPAFPYLARSAWLGKKRERVINNFLLGGPIAQHLWHKGNGVESKKDEQTQIAGKIYRALFGHNSCVDNSVEAKEILSVVLGPQAFSYSAEPAIERLKTMSSFESVMKIQSDEISHRVTADTISICELEEVLPRMQWLQVLMTFLRFALPMWLLAQMRVTGLLHAWMLDAIDNESVADDETITQSISERNRSLLHPTLTATREIFEHIDAYMKRRVELNILLYCLESVAPDQLKDRILNLSDGPRDVIGIQQLLILARSVANDIRGMERFKKVAAGLDVSRFLTREGELFPAWRNPLNEGQGKNIDEFFRVLYRAQLGDEAGGCLLTPEGRGVGRGFRVFPGQLLLKTVTYLAAKRKLLHQRRGGVGKLVLQDVEDHFGEYGVDFSSAADARPLLMRELQAMGLLTGSPDAGSSVAVACPYPIA